MMAFKLHLDYSLSYFFFFLVAFFFAAFFLAILYLLEKSFSHVDSFRKSCSCAHFDCLNYILQQNN